MPRLIFPMVFLALFALNTPVHAQQTPQYPKDAQAVAYAIAAKMTGKPGPQTITFASDTDNDMTGAVDRYYTGFTEAAPVFIAYRNDAAGTAYNADLTGFLHLRDPAGRMVSLRFVARYTVNGPSIHIYQCVVATAPPTDVYLTVFMVPADRFKQQSRVTRSDWTQFYNFVRANAYDPRHDPSRKTTYYVVSFAMNRLPDSARFEAIVGDRKSARRSQDNLARNKDVYMDYLGWRVHMFKAQLNPTSQQSRFYINYYYTPQKNGDRTHLARYDCKPSATGPSAPVQQVTASPTPTPVELTAPEQQPWANKQPAPQQTYAPAPVRTSAPAASPTNEGPYGKGTAFLNPIFPEDVAVIQTRLHQLGYYKGTIDQNWGTATKRAMDNFAVKYGFPKGQWSLGLQKTLFKGTGQ